MAKWLTVARVYIDSETQNISGGNVAHPEWFYEGRVESWGYIDRSIPTPPGGLPQVSDARIRVIDTDRKWRDLLAYQTPRRRRVELKFLLAGDSESYTPTIFKGEIVDAEFGPGYVDLTVQDTTFSWLDEEIPGFINRTNYPDLAEGLDEAFFYRIYGINVSQDENPQGVVELPHIGMVDGLDRWAVSVYPVLQVHRVYALFPGDAVFSLVAAPDWVLTTEDRVFVEMPNTTFTVQYVDFLVEQPAGTRVRIDVTGAERRPAFGSLPELPIGTTMRNPVDVLIRQMLEFQDKLGRDIDFNFEEWAEVRELFETGSSDFGPIYCDGVLEAMTIREFLARWLVSFQTDMPQERDGRIGLKYAPETRPDRPHFTDRRYIVRESFHETIARPTVNRVKVHSDYNFATKEFARIIPVDNDGDQLALAPLQLDSSGETILDSNGDPAKIPLIEEDSLKFYWVRDEATMLTMAARFLSWVALGSYRQKFLLPFPEVFDQIELGDVIGITHTEGLEEGGYQNREVVVRRLTSRLDSYELEVYSILRVPQEILTPVTIDVAGAAAAGDAELEMNMSGMNLDVVWEMVSRPQQSSGGGAKQYNSSLIQFDPAWFDGSELLEFWVEVVAVNSHATLPYSVYIRNQSGLGIVHEFVIPANTTKVFMSETFTPIQATYIMTFPQTAVGHQLQAWSLRIRVKQRGATKTRVQIPIMMGGAINESDLVYGNGRFVIAGDTGYLEESSCLIFLKDADTWATVNNWTLETVAGNTNILGSASFRFAIRNENTGQYVVENLHTVGGSATELVSGDFAHNAANFDDGDTFVAFTRETASHASNSLLLKANLYVTLTNLSKLALYYRMLGRQLLDYTPADDDQVTAVYFDTTATENTPGTAVIRVFQGTSPEYGDPVSAIAGVSINPSGGKAHYRLDVTDLLPSGERFYIEGGGPGTGVVTAAGFLIFKKSL